jgi:PIN domain nuclease of toxin-antitoxin system
VKLLADTHTFLWFILDDPALSGRAKELLEDPTSERLLSIGSLWEIAIKHSLGKLSLAKPFAEFIPEQLQQNRFQVLDLRVEHLVGVARLPFHHRDPFDRMLVAQSLANNLPVLSADDAFDAYGVRRIW